MNLLRAICSWKANGFCFGLLLATLVSAQAEPFANIGVAAPSLNVQTLTAKIKSPPRPTLTITVPANSTALTEPDIIITGTASGKVALAGVFCQLTNVAGLVTNWTSAQTGDNWKNWWINLTLAPGTNFVQAYAVDQNGNFSKTNQVKLIGSAALGKLVGTTITVPSQDYQISFSSGTNGTFSDGGGVGTYSYRKTGPLTGKLSLHYTAPPAASNNDAVVLQFDGSTNGNFVDADDFTASFSLTAATNLAPPLLNGAELGFASTNGQSASLMIFLDSPTVLTNGTLFVTSNPVNIALNLPYPGNVGDRVRVTFNHFSLQSGIWVSNVPVAVTGTVIDIGSTNTVLVLLDTTSLGSRTEVFSPMANVPLNILTFYYTNYIAGNVTDSGDGTFLLYSNYSLIGSLLKINRLGTNEFYVLTYTNATPSGTYFQESHATGGGSPTMDSGIFSIVQPPIIATQPVSVTTTNGGTVTFTVAAAGTQPITYQWQLNGTNLTDITNGEYSVSGSLTTNLTITAVTTNDAGSYQAIVVNDVGNATSQAATLTIAIPPIIITQPQTTAALTNTTVAFTLTATGTPQLHYQWYNNPLNTPLTNGLTSWNSTISGSSTTNLTINSVTNNDGGYYQLIVTNMYGSATSSIVELIITNNTGMQVAP